MNWIMDTKIANVHTHVIVNKAVDAKLVILFNLSRFAFYYVMFVGTENLVSHRWTQINIVYSAQYRDTLIEISG